MSLEIRTLRSTRSYLVYFTVIGIKSRTRVWIALLLAQALALSFCRSVPSLSNKPFSTAFDKSFGWRSWYTKLYINSMLRSSMCATPCLLKASNASGLTQKNGGNNSSASGVEQKKYRCFASFLCHLANILNLYSTQFQHRFCAQLRAQGISSMSIVLSCHW